MHEPTLMYVSSGMKQQEGPAYLRIVKTLSVGIDSGELKPGLALPSQRVLADHLGLHFTTVTRAYGEAKKRGLISAHRGQGTVVAAGPATARRQPRQAAAASVIDLTAAWPPTLQIPLDLSAALVSLGGESGVGLFSARSGKRDPWVVEAAIEWLQPLFSSSLQHRVTSSAGTRGALLALMRLVVGNGGTLLTEAMTWPTLRTLAGMFGIRLRAVAMDEEGIVPAALEAAVRETGAKALYCVPNAQNPTNAVMSLARRKQLAAIAEHHDLRIFEDDVYGELMEQRLPPLADFAPRQTYFIVSLAKCLSPSLRVAYVVAPSEQDSLELGDLLRATMLSPAPIEEALVVHTMNNRSAFRHIARVRAETRMRSSIVHEVLRGFRPFVKVGPLSLWLSLPDPWQRAAFVENLRHRGVIGLPSDAFSVDRSDTQHAIRLATGTAHDQQQLRKALDGVVQLLSSSPTLSTLRT